jgi:hypothetical protein
MGGLADFFDRIRQLIEDLLDWLHELLVQLGLAPRYPYRKKTRCGWIEIFIASNEPNIDDGAIVFDFKPNEPPTCECMEFGWIQHQRLVAGGWRFDNNAAGMGRGMPSDPTQSPQPVQRPPGGGHWDANPWYGAHTRYGSTEPAGFSMNPSPQPRIGDLPTFPDTEFIAQLVCATTGEVLFSWAWGPTTRPPTPLDKLPAKRIPPP